jgi:S1-C subfamily serine protease
MFVHKLFSATVFLLLLLPRASEGQNSGVLPELVRRSERAVVLLRVYDSAGQQLGLGSGFAVADGRVVTNAHVLEGAAYVEVYDYQDRLLGTTDHAHSLSTRVDLALLPAIGAIAGVLPLESREPPVGESIVVFGAPQGLTNTVSNGIVSGYREWEGIRWMQITAPISPGSSGGPVLNERGQVVGVSVALLGDGQNLNFAVPVSDVYALVGSPPGRLAFPGAASTRRGRASAEPAAHLRPHWRRWSKVS